MQGRGVGAVVGFEGDCLRVQRVRHYEFEPARDYRDSVLNSDGGAAGEQPGGDGVERVREVPCRGGERENGGQQEED